MAAGHGRMSLHVVQLLATVLLMQLNQGNYLKIPKDMVAYIAARATVHLMLICPQRIRADNVQNIALQGYAGTLDKCSVCHGYNPTGPGPHGLYYEGGNAATLPFTETWENNNGTRNTNGEIYSADTYSWTFETTESDRGRARWGNEAFQTHDGTGALTMDKYPGNSVACANKAILTIDLSNYTASTNLELSFWWADHGDEEHPGDKVWIRGSNTDQWIEAYDLNPKQNASNIFTLVDNIDIDNILANASPSQTVSSTFQVSFGQEDDTSTPYDGISFDDISIVENSVSPSTLPFVETWENNNGTRNTNGEIYSADTYSWTFETTESDRGRARWGNEAFQTHDGTGALTMDKYPGNSVVCANKAILTIDLSNYTASTNLELSFWWADHGDEEHPGDKVWIRGSNTDQWIEAYDLNPKQNASNIFTLVDNIDIDNILANASPSQTVSSTFQVSFGQEDDTSTPYDGISFDDISIVENSVSPSTLPFVETWENNNGTRNTNGEIYSADTYSWTFETTESDRGRARWGNEAFQTHDGTGALTMDKYPGNSVVCANKAILTIDLSNYTASTNLELSFWWADHGDEEHPGDKVWIRGSNTDQWIEAYDLNPKQNASNIFTLVDNIDIDNILANASPSQTVSSTFQVSFGQEDDTSTPYDGISFDDISITEVAPPAQNLKSAENQILVEKPLLKIYSNSGDVVIQNEEAINSEKMIVLIYDMMGRKVIESTYPQNSTVRIPVNVENSYLVVKVICGSEVYTSKVFIR